MAEILKLLVREVLLDYDAITTGHIILITRATNTAFENDNSTPHDKNCKLLPTCQKASEFFGLHHSAD